MNDEVYAIHSSWEDDLENDVIEHNIGSSSPECVSEREDEGDTENSSIRRTKLHRPNPVDLLFTGTEQLKSSSDQLVFSNTSFVPLSQKISEEPMVSSADSEAVQLPVKRKRGRPPGKKKQIKSSLDYNGLSNVHEFSSDPFVIHGSPTSSPRPIPLPSFFPIAVALPQSNLTPQGVPFKRGRGRPRKFPLNATPARPSSNGLIYNPNMPSDLEICNYVKDLIRTSRNESFTQEDLALEEPFNIGADDTSALREGEASGTFYNTTNDSYLLEHSSAPSSPGSSPILRSVPHRKSSTTQQENAVLTPDLVMKELEGHYGVNLSSRKYFLNEVFSVLWT